MTKALGSTSLDKRANNYFLYPNGESAVDLSYAGAPVVTGQFAGWVPIGTEPPANGFAVAERCRAPVSMPSGTSVPVAITSQALLTPHQVRASHCNRLNPAFSKT